MRYQIWNRMDPIITPIGEVLSAEQWIARYPMMGVASIVPVIAAGEINGGFAGTLGSLKQVYESIGAVFTEGLTNQELLEEIDAYETLINTTPEAADASAMDILLGVD